MPITHARVASEGITLTADLQYLVPVEYYDSAAAQTVLATHSFVLPLNTSQAALIVRAQEYGRTIRAAQSSLAGARAAVPAGATTPID